MSRGRRTLAGTDVPNGQGGVGESPGFEPGGVFRWRSGRTRLGCRSNFVGQGVTGILPLCTLTCGSSGFARISLRIRLEALI